MLCIRICVTLLIFTTHYSLSTDCDTDNIGNVIFTNCSDPVASNTTCELQCMEGYFYEGSGSFETTCQANGTWDLGGMAPCQEIQCDQEPDKIDHGIINGNCKAGSNFKTECKVTCDDGYYVSKGGTIVCDDADPSDDSNSDGFWNDNDTTCMLLQCLADPNEIAHGNIIGNCTAGSDVNTECNVTCEEGYYLSGGGTIVCEDSNPSDDSKSDGFWNDNDTTCMLLQCQADPDEIAHGDIIGNCTAGSDLNTKCNITCEEGYYLSQGGTIACEDSNPSDDSKSDGFWSDNDTTCMILQCQADPDEIDHGNITGNCAAGSDFNTECNVTCEDGFYLSGGGKVLCVDSTPLDDSNESGIWNTTGTTCNAYMVLDVNPEISGVKGMNVNLTANVTSSAPNGDVNITVTVVSSPGGKINGAMLQLAASDNGILEYYITLFDLTEEQEGVYTIESKSYSEDSLYPNISRTGTQSLTVQVIPENFNFFINGTMVNDTIIYTRGDPNNIVRCEAYGKPTPTYEWTNFSRHDTSGSIYSEQDMLYLENSYFSDNGTYACYASNTVSELYNLSPNKEIYIGINGVPVMRSDDTEFALNDDFNLTCYMDANPVPTNVSWRSDGVMYNFDNSSFASMSNIVKSDGGDFYQYQNELNLYSQLCMGEQTIQCSSSNAIGESNSSTEYVINKGTYYLDLQSQSYMAGSDENTTKVNADMVCSNSSGHLVFVTDELTEEFLNSTFNYDFYTGAVKNTAGNWTWGENGDSLNPNNRPTGDGNCAIFTRSGLQAVSCDNEYPYVCQISASGFPQDLTATTEQCQPRQLVISWLAADARFQTATYRVVIFNTNSSDSVHANEILQVEDPPFWFNCSDVEPDTAYRVEVYSAVDVCVPEYTPMVTTTATTGFDTPQTVEAAKMESSDDESICTVSWTYNETFRWQISSYQVNITATNAQTKISEETSVVCNPGIEMNCSFTMEANTQYHASILATSACGVSGAATQINSNTNCISKVSAPDALIVSDSPISDKELNIDAKNGIKVEVPGQDQRNGEISCLFLILTIDDTKENSNKREPKNSTQYVTEKDGEYFVYATNNTAIGFNFTIGNDTQKTVCNPVTTTRKKRQTESTASVEAQNKMLQQSKFYRYYIMSSTDNDGSTYFVQSSNLSVVYETITVPVESLAWIAAIVIPIFLIIVGIAAYMYYRERRKERHEQPYAPRTEIPIGVIPKDYGHDNNFYESVDDVRPVPKSHRVKANDLPNVYEHKHKDEDRLLREDYKEIKDCASKLSGNFNNAKEYRGLNRYVNILPSNDATVLFSPTTADNPQGYINASYIDGYNHQRKFIATQGPKPNTINDFWKMVWDQQSEAIVMLTNVDENGKRKCEKYWPNTGETVEYGETVVTGENVSECGPVVIRKFTINPKKSHKQGRVVLQYHYIAWPDHGVPVTTSDLFNLRRMVKLHHTKTDPIVVHCSAGVGRTGTFIALDCLMDDMAATSSIDVTSQVWAMRERRTEMVQTSDQYVLLYKMLLEHHLLKETDDNVANLETGMRNDRLSEIVLERELEKAGEVKPLETEQFIGSRPENMRFNRDRSTIPYDRNLVSIRMRPEEHSARYFNASWIEGYSRADIFIATQDPLPGTEELFWRMALDNNVKCIVMIKKRGETQDITGRYWADQKLLDFGKISVSVLENFPERNLTMRKIFVKEVVLTSARSSTITHFEFNAWPEDASVGADAILELISRVQKEKSTVEGGSEPVVVHCGNGSECVGTFCAITNILERIKMEHRVDVMRVVKDLRDMRPGMVVTMDEYKLCYAGIQSYLSSFETYSNFQ